MVFITILTLIAIYYILQSFLNTMYEFPIVGIKMFYSAVVVATLMMYMIYLYNNG